jgi:hypothetical protein
LRFLAPQRPEILNFFPMAVALCGATGSIIEGQSRARCCGRRRRKEAKMRRLLILGMIMLAGCQSVRGPLQPREPQRPDDPHYTITEQQRRGRDQLPIPEESRNIAPQIPVTTEPTQFLR